VLARHFETLGLNASYAPEPDSQPLPNKASRGEGHEGYFSRC
jgi:hypothetical protein